MQNETSVITPGDVRPVQRAIARLSGSRQVRARSRKALLESVRSARRRFPATKAA